MLVTDILRRLLLELNGGNDSSSESNTLDDLCVLGESILSILAVDQYTLELRYAPARDDSILSPLSWLVRDQFREVAPSSGCSSELSRLDNKLRCGDVLCSVSKLSILDTDILVLLFWSSDSRLDIDDLRISGDPDPVDEFLRPRRDICF